MSDLIGFLEARISEDEAVARAAASEPAGPHWGSYFREVLGCTPQAWVADTEASEYAAHSARHDPARVLAECAAKRAMLANVPKPTDVYDTLGGTSEYVLRCMAAVHEKHPDYNPAWG